MENMFFLNRIERKNGKFVTGIEIHDSRDAAILSYHGRMKLAYNNPSAPELDFSSCKVMYPDGSTVRPYAATWRKTDAEGNTFFVYYIRHNGEEYNKGIDECVDLESAFRAFHAYAEYGHDNPKFPNISYTYSAITDMSGAVIISDVWSKPDPEPEPEPEPEQESVPEV